MAGCPQALPVRTCSILATDAEGLSQSLAGVGRNVDMSDIHKQMYARV